MATLKTTPKPDSTTTRFDNEGVHTPYDIDWSASGVRPFAYAVSMAATSCKPRSRIACSRILNFWILPVTVVGKLSTNFT